MSEQTNEQVMAREIVVCDHCEQASCWLGFFLCERSRSAGTKRMTVRQLHTQALENPEYWFRDPTTGALDRQGLSAYMQVTGRETRQKAAGIKRVPGPQEPPRSGMKEVG